MIHLLSDAFELVCLEFQIAVQLSFLCARHAGRKQKTGRRWQLLRGLNVLDTLAIIEFQLI